MLPIEKKNTCYKGQHRHANKSKCVYQTMIIDLEGKMCVL